MAEKIKYSVIIPVYNAEATIKRCLDSILHNIPESAEIVLINDGSTDKSGKICELYAGEHLSIQYYKQENGGVSRARNVGLDNAKGRYILFADSDDYVSEDYWTIIDGIITDKRPDMLQFGFQEHGKTIKSRHTGDFECFSVKDTANKVSQCIRSYMFSSLQVRAFSGDIIRKKHLRFDPKLRIGEDQTFIFKFAMHMRSLISISNELYMVDIGNEESLSRQRRDDLEEQLMAVNRTMFSTVNNARIDSKRKKLYKSAVAWVYYRSAYSCCKELLKYDLTDVVRKKKIREICNRFKAEKIRPMDVKCFIIAVPILMKSAIMIDLMIQSR